MPGAKASSGSVRFQMRGHDCRGRGRREGSLLRLGTLRVSGDRGRTPWSWPIERPAGDGRPISPLTHPDPHSPSSSLARRRLDWIPDRIISSSLRLVPSPCLGQRPVHHRHEVKVVRLRLKRVQAVDHPDGDRRHVTNITPDHRRAFRAFTSGEYANFALFSCFIDGSPGAAIVAVNRYPSGARSACHCRRAGGEPGKRCAGRSGPAARARGVLRFV